MKKLLAKAMKSVATKEEALELINEYFQDDSKEEVKTEGQDNTEKKRTKVRRTLKRMSMTQLKKRIKKPLMITKTKTLKI